MYRNSRYYIAIVFCFLALTLSAQESMVQMTGVVRDAQTGKVIPQASVIATGSRETTVTNQDGSFVLKSRKMPASISVSCLGYQTAVIPISADRHSRLKISLKPASIRLNEVIVNVGDPRAIVEEAVRKIPDNYSRDNELLQCFYRETTQKGRRYIYVAEAVTDMYKASYTRLVNPDRVSIIKGRRIVSPHASDTLGAKMQGGPTLPVELDLMKNRDYLFTSEELDLYNLKLEVPTMLNDRQQLVISFSPAFIADHVLFYGKMYIDMQTLAFTRIEMSLDMSDPKRATEVMLLHKPMGVRFRPREMTTTVAYTFDGKTSRIHYVHSDVRFYCEWKKKFFASPYHVEAEMVVTDLLSSEARPIAGASSFRSKDSFYDKVQFFSDPDFWRDYNIIEPTESLEHAIGKLIKKKKTEN